MLKNEVILNNGLDQKSSMTVMEFLRKYNIFITLALTIIISAIVTNGLFLDSQNLLNIGERASIVGIVALGQMLVILTGGIDLSIAGILAIGFVIIGKATHAGVPVPVAILLVIIACMAAGGINGIMVLKTKIPPFMITMATLMFYSSLALFLTGSSQLKYDKLQDFINTTFNMGKLGARLFPTTMWLLLTAVVIFVLARTRFGNNLYAVGGKEAAAKLSGIKTLKAKFSVYLMSGFFCAVAAIVLAYRIKASNPDVGMSLNMDSIAAVILGGTNINGGEGSVYGTLVGAIIMAALINLLNLVNANPYIQESIKGLMLIAFVFITQYLSKRK